MNTQFRHHQSGETKNNKPSPIYGQFNSLRSIDYPTDLTMNSPPSASPPSASPPSVSPPSVSPPSVSPKQSSPSNASPPSVSPKQSSPSNTSLPNTSLPNASPQHASPSNELLSNASPQHGRVKQLKPRYIQYRNDQGGPRPFPILNGRSRQRYINRGIPSISGLSLELEQLSPEQRESRRIEFHVLYNKIRRNHPELGIQSVPETLDLPTIYRIYTRQSNEILAKQRAELYKYREGMKIIWWIIEAVGLFVLKIESFRGFKDYQEKQMRQYEEMLLEFSDKIGGDGGTLVGSSWPIEGRIMFWSFVHAMVFVGCNAIASYFGTGIAGTVRETITSNVAPSEKTNDQVAGGIDFGNLLGSLSNMANTLGINTNNTTVGAAPERARKGPRNTE